MLTLACMLCVVAFLGFVLLYIDCKGKNASFFDIENTTLVYAFCSINDLEKYLDEIIASCKDLKHELSQQSIAVEIDNCMNFI